MPGEVQFTAHAGVYPATNFGAFDRRFGTNFPDDCVKLTASDQQVYFEFVMPRAMLAATSRSSCFGTRRRRRAARCWGPRLRRKHRPTRKVR